MGYTGFTGYTGYTGCTGERGERGPQGDRGSDGAAGAAGSDGKDGDRGDKGDRGDRGSDGPMGTVSAVASVLACAVSVAACGIAVTQCQGYAAAAIAANGAAGAAGLQDLFNDYQSVASGTTEYFYDALDNISQAANTVNGVAQNVNTLQSVIGTVGTSAVVGGAAGGLAGYLTLSNVKDKATGDVYYLDNSYNIGFNTVGDVSFNANVYVGQNLTVTGDINSQYLTNNYYTKTQVTTLVAPTTAISYNDVNVLTDYIKNGKFTNPVVVGNEPYPYLWFTPNELSAFCWTTPYPNSLNILNGISDTTLVRPLITVEVHFPSPALIGAVQYIWLDGKSEIQQVMNNIPVGVYQFSFRYSYLPGSPANPINLYFDGVLIDILPTYYNGNTNAVGFTYNSSLDSSSKTTWYTYTKTITVSLSGNKTLRFVGPSTIYGKDIAIANVSFISSTQVKETCISGALINSVAIPIINPTFTDGTNKGTGLFWNTNSNQKSDIINYAGAGGEGGVDFWTINDFKPATNIASISNTGDISCNTLTSTNIYTKSYIDFSLNENYYNKPYFDTSLNTNYYTQKKVDELRAADYNTIKDTLDNNIGNFYNKTYIDFSLNEHYYNKPYINNTYYTKTAIDTNVYTKSAIDTNLNTNYYTKTAIDTNLNTNYYTKTAIDTSFSDVYSKISNPTYVGATFSEDVRVKKKLYIGKDDPAGYQISTDQAYMEYVGLDTNKTVLRINTTSDILNSGENDSINLNPTAGVGVNTDEPKYKFDVFNGTINSTLNAGINLRASNFSDSNYVGLASYLNQGNYNPITQLGDSGLIYNTDQTTHGLCIVPQSSTTSGVRLDNNGSMVLNEAVGSTVSKYSGSLIIKHQNLNGVSSIVFPSSTPTDGGDYGYIKYVDDINNNAAATVPYGGESSRLVIGVENDATGNTIADKIVLMTPSSSGCVGINKMTPVCALDVTGDGCISGKLGINNTTPSCALDVTGDGKISGTLTTNNLTVNGTISGGFTFGNITTGNITNTNVINTGGLTVTGSISTGSLTASGSIIGGGNCKIGDHTTDGIFIAGRAKTSYPNPNDPYMIQIEKGLEIFWDTVADSRNFYTGFAGETTLMNYAGGLGQGGYSFQTTPGTGITPTADPTVLFQMLKGKDFTINGGLTCGDISANKVYTTGVYVSNKQVRLIRHFIAFDSTTNQQGKTIGCVANYNENLSITYISAGKYYCTFTNINPSNAYYSVSISGTWNGQSDDNSGMIFSVDSKTTTGFCITQKGYLYYAVNSNTYTCSTEISVSY